MTGNREGRATDDEVLHFITQHTREWHFKRVDEPWLKGLLFGGPARNRLLGDKTRAA